MASSSLVLDKGATCRVKSRTLPMIETANNESHGLSTPDNDPAVESRIFRVMALFVAIGVIASAPFVPWRSTAGLALGGILSLFNYHWLRSSISALIVANAR